MPDSPSEQELQIQRQVAFTAGLFQGDLTIRTLLESLVEGVVIIDASGTILLVNSPAEQIFGYAKDELIGKAHAILIPERLRNVHEAHESGFFTAPQITQLRDLVGLRRDGSEFPLEISLSFIETVNGVLALAFFSDITARKRVETHLRSSEELFHIQAESVKDYAFFTLDAQGKVLNWNVGAERLNGYRAEEILDRHFSCFYSEEQRLAGEPEEKLKTAAAEGQVAAEGWRIRKDGSRFWADVMITALLDETGNLWGFSKVIHDITWRKRQEDALRYSEARYRALFQDNPTMIFTLNSDFAILSANPFAASQLGYSIEELEGESVLNVFHEEDRATAENHLRGCLDNPNEARRWQKLRKRRKDGALLWVEETAQAIYDLNGALNILVVCQDVTERKRAEEEREQLLVQLDSVLNSITEGVIISDLEGNVLTMNPAALTMLGVESMEQARRQLFQDSFELIDLDERPVPFEQWPMSRALRAERFTNYELQVRCKVTGKTWVASFSGAPVQTRSGDIILCVSTFRDITDAKRAVEALRKSEEKFSRIFQAAPALIVITSLEDGRCIDINERGLQMLGFSREEMVGRTMLELSIWESASARGRMTQLLKKEGQVRDLEVTFRDKNGKQFTGLFSAQYLELDGHRYILSIIPDVTDRKRMEEEIVRLNKDLAARATELEAFNYSIAHDLRKPLTVINGYCQALQIRCGEQLDDECKDFVSKAYNGTLRMNTLIEALLNFSRLAHIEMRRVNVDLSAMAREVAEELQQAEPERLVDIRITDGIAADADPNLLRVVLANLLGNAWKFTAVRAKAVIEVGVLDINGPTYLVRDNGIGFSMAEASKLFMPFQQLITAEEGKGYGIGLATVERIIGRHGGKIWAEGKPDQGACFYFTLSSSPLPAGWVP